MLAAIEGVGIFIAPSLEDDPVFFVQRRLTAFGFFSQCYRAPAYPKCDSRRERRGLPFGCPYFGDGDMLIPKIGTVKCILAYQSSRTRVRRLSVLTPRQCEMPRKRSIGALAELPQYYSLASIARKLNLPYRKACRLMRSDVLACDALLEFSTPLFLSTRLPQHAANVARFDSERLTSRLCTTKL